MESGRGGTHEGTEKEVQEEKSTAINEKGRRENTRQEVGSTLKGCRGPRKDDERKRNSGGRE